MSYAKDQQKFRREHKKRIKEEKKQSQINREKADKAKHDLYFAKAREQKQEEEKEKERLIEKIECNTKFLESIGNKVSYKKWLLYRDILYSGFYQIETDLKREKITRTELKEAMQFLLDKEVVTDNQAQLINQIILQK